MNKEKFAALVQEVGGYKTKKEALDNIEVFIESIEKALLDNEEVKFQGFGIFSTALQAGKTGKVPGTDKTYTTEDKMVPKFKAGKGLKDKIAKNKLVK